MFQNFTSLKKKKKIGGGGWGGEAPFTSKGSTDCFQDPTMLRKTNDFTTVSRESSCVNMKLDVLAFQNFARCLSYISKAFSHCCIQVMLENAWFLERCLGIFMFGRVFPETTLEAVDFEFFTEMQWCSVRKRHIQNPVEH